MLLTITFMVTTKNLFFVFIEKLRVVQALNVLIQLCRKTGFHQWTVFFHISCVEEDAGNMNETPGYDPLGEEKRHF